MTAAAKAGSKPALRIARTSTVPSPGGVGLSYSRHAGEDDAGADVDMRQTSPDMASRDSAKAKIREASPARFIKFPARMNSGIASNGKLSSPDTMR